MQQILRADERGKTNMGWLNSAHSFSFGHYYNPDRMGFGSLRVINDDRVIPGAGFGTHGHRDMEIISYVLEGALEHEDSMGNGSVIRPGDVQRMSAGTGVLHSEMNHSQTDPVRFLQIWFLPEREGIAPGYEQKNFEPAERNGCLRLVASRDGREGSIRVHQDLNMYAGLFHGAQKIRYEQKANRQLWLQVAQGSIHVDDLKLSEGDGLALAGESDLELYDGEHGEVILFDMARNREQ